MNRSELKEIISRFGLSRRENDVLRAVLKGMKNSDIAAELGIVEQTVKDHMSRIYRKMGVENRFELLYYFVKKTNRKVSKLAKSVHDLRAAERELKDVLLEDELTGVYNRRGFVALADSHATIAKRENRRIFLLYCDVDDLKFVNDTFGHHEGDRLLRETGRILRETFRESDVIARVGGDEFVVMPLGNSQSHADAVVSRLRAKLGKWNSNGGAQHPLSLSFGIACYDPQANEGFEEVVDRADREMYMQKRLKKRARVRNLC